MKEMIWVCVCTFFFCFVGYSCKTLQRAEPGSSDVKAPGVPSELDSWTKIKSAEFSMKEPPIEQSEVFTNDFAMLHQFQESRLAPGPDPDCELAKRQRFPTFKAFYGSTAQILSEEEFAKVAPLLNRVTDFTERVAGYFKGKFERVRPFNTDTTLSPCVTRPTGNKAYPSSHAAVATADACVLARVFPDRSDKLEKYGAYLGNLRAIVGVHHPSDIAAGQTLGKDVCKRLFSEPSFEEEIQPLLP